MANLPPRSSVTDRLAAFTDIGGVNSIRSFTKSWQRAAGFTEVVPQRHSLVFAPDQVPIGGPVGDMDFERVDLETGTTLQARSGTSLLRQYLEASQTGGSAVEEDVFEPSTGHLLPRSSSDEREAESGTGARPLRTFRSPSPAGTASIFGTPPHLATPITGSYGSYPTYGTIYSDTGRPSMEHLAAAWHQQQESGGDMPDSEDQPILVKEVEQNGKFVLTVEGQSTLPQTIFNSIKYVSYPQSVSSLAFQTPIMHKSTMLTKETLLLPAPVQCSHRRRSAQLATRNQVRRLVLRHDHSLLVRRRHLLHCRPAGQMHEPGPQPHHLLRHSLHLVWPKRPASHQRPLYPRAGWCLRSPHGFVRRLSGPLVSRSPHGDSVEACLLFVHDTPELSALAVFKLHKHHWNRFLHQQ